MTRFDVDLEEQVSTSVDDVEVLCCGSETESDEHEAFDSSPNPNPFEVLRRGGMIKLRESELEHEIVAKSFVSGLGRFSAVAEIVEVHKNCNSNPEKKARFESFRIFSEAVATKCGGDANLKYAWYGSSMDQICQIVSHGFSRCSNSIHSESHGVGVYLSPTRFSVDCVSCSVEDENGLRHMLLSRVILGKTEVISPGSTQFHPSCDKFDTGVDSVLAPRKYIVWGALMNSYIQPIYVISFKTPQPKKGVEMKWGNGVKPSSPWMCFSSLMCVLSRFLEPTKMGLIKKCHGDFIRNKIPRSQLVNRVRHVAGDRLLIAVIKNYKRNTR